MYKVKFEDKDHGWANWQKGLRFLGGKQSLMEVGLLEGITPEDVIDRGAINEVHDYGDGVRSWFRTTMDMKGDRYLKLLGEWFVEEMEKGLGPGGDARIKAKLGRLVAYDLSVAIERWEFPANRRSTIDKKGFNDPLIETGDLSAAPTYRILKPGEKPPDG